MLTTSSISYFIDNEVDFISIILYLSNINNAYYNEVKQREIILTWYNNKKSNTLQSRHIQARNFALHRKINTEISSTKKIRQWILSLKQISKNAEKIEVNNIRLYL